MQEKIRELVVNYGRAERAFGKNLADPDGDAGTTADRNEDSQEAFTLLQEAIEEFEANQRTN